MPLNHTSSFADLTEAQYGAIGKIVVEWSNIEFLLSVLLSRLLRTPEFLGRTYATGLSAVRLQQAITEAVAIHRHRYGGKRVLPTQLAEIDDLNARVTMLRSERNKISHFCWMRWTDDAVSGTAFAGGVYDKKYESKKTRKLTVTDLKRMHREAFELTERLMKLTESLPQIDE